MANYKIIAPTPPTGPVSEGKQVEVVPRGVAIKALVVQTLKTDAPGVARLIFGSGRDPIPLNIQGQEFDLEDEPDEEKAGGVWVDVAVDGTTYSQGNLELLVLYPTGRGR